MFIHVKIELIKFVKVIVLFLKISIQLLFLRIVCTVRGTVMIKKERSLCDNVTIQWFIIGTF